MLKSNNFSAQYRIYYEDTDVGGVVYYANYLKFFERARTDFLRSQKILQSELLENEKLIFVVKSCEINYAKPARFDDLIEISTEVKEISAASFDMKQEMRINEGLLASLRVKIVCLNFVNFKPKKIPDNLREILLKIKEF